ncbi:MAG: hypothetical protein KA165_10925 [Saprospiraceae bacterium]|nr:hypothetical protein [Saprospiraceae bacterium]
MAQLSNGAFTTLQEPKFSNATHLNGFFMGLEPARHDFIDWFNTHLAGKGTFAKRRINPDANEDMAAVKREFVEFWDSIPLVYKQPSITLFDFASLMCIAINETGGRFRSTTERCGRGAKDPSGIRHEGLAYAFDKIPKVKKSYNTLADAGNKTALECFSNPVFCAAHRGLGCSDRLSSPSMPDKVDPVWKGEVYPIDKFPFIEDIAETGFIMQADFYKFRGRGPFQITGRAPYRKIAQYIQKYDGTSPVLLKFKERWKSLSADDACYASNDMDWDEIFSVKSVVALSLRTYADIASPAKNMLVMTNDLNRLNEETRAAGSIWSVGRIVSGTEKYANEEYKPRVVEMLEKIASQTQARRKI